MEIQKVLESVQNINSSIDLHALETVLGKVAHLSHKDWELTGTNAQLLKQVLLPMDGGIQSDEAREMFERIIREGRWDCGLKHASPQPWAVLVTGVNGIRKTTTMYQPWFSELLSEAIVIPPSSESLLSTPLPTGANSFFRQLDHMIATICNQEFAALYAMTTGEISKELIHQYSDHKAAIFQRYRTVAELLGVILLQEAQKSNMNCMMETSGRDIAMFKYVDYFFPSQYHKLALHFTINDLNFAKESVDERMVKEILLGKEAIKKKKNNVRDIINCNLGGPYGSEVLEAVQLDSDRVWNEMVLTNQGISQDWYKATIVINAYANEPWTAQAIRPDGSLSSKVYTFLT